MLVEWTSKKAIANAPEMCQHVSFMWINKRRRRRLSKIEISIVEYGDIKDSNRVIWPNAPAVMQIAWRIKKRLCQSRTHKATQDETNRFQFAHFASL